MLHNSSVSKFFLIFSFALLLVFAAGCAEVRFNTLPTPPPTAKLRVFAIPVSGAAPTGPWGEPPEEWARRHVSNVRGFLSRTGVYEVVAEEKVASVLGKKTFLSGDWRGKDWSLVKQVGRVLHADYALVMERSIVGSLKYLEMVLINVETGKRFKVLVSFRSDPDRKDISPIRFAYYEIFRNAKNDMLAAAIRKGRLAAPEFFTVRSSITEESMPPTSAKPVPAPLPPSSTVAKSAAVEKPLAPREISRAVNYEDLLWAEAGAKGRKNLAIYDLDTIEAYRVVALILSEALRQELFKLKLFDLVNRENMVKVLEEMALQQTGLVDEKEAARAGRGLAAQQIVLGRFGISGKSSVLQAKRIDVETQRTLGLGTLRCDLGREDELLQHMTELAIKISKIK